MVTPASILKEALEAPPRSELAEHIGAISELRKKKWPWREIADFLRERGVDTDHSKLLRFMQKQDNRWQVPAAAAYYDALKHLRGQEKISGPHWEMLLFLYHAHNRIATYTQLAKAAERAGVKVSESRPHTYANLEFGKLGKLLGETLEMEFLPSSRRASPFYSSSIGVENSAAPEGAEFELVMHHELAKAIDRLLAESSDATAGAPHE